MKRRRNRPFQVGSGPLDAPGNLQHELGTPLLAAAGLVDLLLDSGLAAEQRTYATALADSIRSALFLVEKTLGSTRSVDVAANHESIVYSPRELIENVRTLYCADAFGKEVAFVVDIAGDIPETVYGDGYKVRQVLVNLVSNALRHSESPSVEIRCLRMRKRGSGAEDGIRVLVKDVGRGIPAAEQESISSGDRPREGAAGNPVTGGGRGLSISRDLVLSMGGDIGMESSVGSGSSFWFTIPARQAARRVAVNCVPVPAGDSDTDRWDGVSTTQPEDADRVLVVEDNEAIAMVSRRILENAGYHVTVVNDAGAAIGISNRQYFAVILLDHRLPDRCGLEVARVIRERECIGGSRSLLILVTAAEIDERIRTRAYDAGIDQILRKPVSPILLETLVRSGTRPAGPGKGNPAQPATLDPEAVLELDGIAGGKGKSLLQDLLDKTASGMRGWCSAIDSAARSGDIRSVRRLSHGLLGVCRQLGATRMVTVCERLAAGDGRGALSKVPVLTETLILEFSLFEAELQRTAQRQLELSESTKPDQMAGHF